MRELVNFDSGERLRLSVEDKALVSVSQKGVKTKQSKKEFASEQEAKKACVKKEWESLKKGFVLQDSEAKTGKACLHVYIGGGYTGALSFASVRDEIYVYKSGGQKDGGVPSDILVRLDQSRGYITDLKSGNAMAEFTLDHVVKNCEAKFIDGKLAVRTDYGCFSLYEI